MTEPTKQCTRCDQDKPLDQFTPSRHDCKPCRAEDARRRRAGEGAVSRRVPEGPPGTQRCSRCRNYKTEDQYTSSQWGRSGGACQACRAEGERRRGAREGTERARLSSELAEVKSVVLRIAASLGVDVASAIAIHGSDSSRPLPATGQTSPNLGPTRGDVVSAGSELPLVVAAERGPVAGNAS